MDWKLLASRRFSTTFQANFAREVLAKISSFANNHVYLLKEPRTEEQAKGDLHSAFNIRINAALSQMPEFTRAFSCKKGDAMYAEEKDSCYVFGPKS